MYTTAQRTVMALQQIATEIEAAGTNMHRQLATMVRLGRMLRSNPLVVAAVDELTRLDASDEAQLRKLKEDLAAEFTASMRVVASGLQKPFREASLTAINRQCGAKLAPDGPRDLSEALDIVRNGNALEWRWVSRISSVLRNLRAAVQGVSDEDPAIDDLISPLTTAIVVGDKALQAEEIERVHAEMSSRKAVDLFTSHADTWEELLCSKGAFNSWTQKILLERHIELVPGLVARIVAQLDDGTARHYAILRLRVFFEQFECAALCAELRQAEEAKSSREKILQRAMDSFLFREGYFPITHAEASRGALDTIVLQTDTSGLPPILIELKQVVRFELPHATRAMVSLAIESARGEVARYHAHMVTAPTFANLSPVIVVVHTCAEDLSDLETADVVLIDLGGATPSRKKPRRPTSADA